MYYAIGGSDGNEGRGQGVFRVLRSSNLVQWTDAGWVLEQLPAEYGDTYWAPEVISLEGRFWMYYSVGFSDRMHHLRAAVSDRPEGPYRDIGVRLTNPFSCPFAIDPSPFQDTDGQLYLLYARDFLDTDGGARVGTGIVIHRLATPTQLAGEPRTILRARYDWQRYQKDRVIYGGVYDWHTLEGPTLRKRHGRYWCLYSAGRWQSETYGLDFAVADRVLGPYEAGNNSSGPRLLKTVPGEVIGPGHASVITGPDGATEYLVYHAWDAAMTARRMCLDRIEWTGDGPRTPGPTFTPQPLK